MYDTDDIKRYILFLKNECGLSVAGQIAPNKNLKIGTSAYSVVILGYLEEITKYYPDQSLIAFFMRRAYICNINRKTVGRNIKALRKLGYNIEYVDAERGYRLLKS